MTHLPLAYETKLLHEEIQPHVRWDMEKYPHLLTMGNTGSGKSYFTNMLLARIMLHHAATRLWHCDYKNEAAMFF